MSGEGHGAARSGAFLMEQYCRPATLFEEGENIRVADAFVADIILNAWGDETTAYHHRRR